MKFTIQILADKDVSSMMSYSPPNYTDGVPIKISERYKPPPPIHLPTKIIQQLAKTEISVAFEDYNFDLEHKIISKTSEWINWRARDKSERQERIHQRELTRLKQLEDEQKQKLNQVSYPSTDDISSCDEDEELSNEATVSQQQTIPIEKPFSPTNFNTILMPTQALQDPISVKKSHRRYASNSSNKIDFSFFESDTSPFDHLEMKSMNEMEVLAQILRSTVQNEPASNLEKNSSSESESSEPQKNNNNVVPETPSDATQQQHQSQVQSNQQQQYQSYAPQLYNNSSFYGGTNFYNFASSNPTATQPHYNHMNHQNQFLYPQNYAVNYDYNHYQALTNNNTIVNGTHDKSEESKSRSVPSILKELNDELNNSERRRIRNNSQNSHREVSQDGKHLSRC